MAAEEYTIDVSIDEDAQQIVDAAMGLAGLVSAFASKEQVNLDAGALSRFADSLRDIGEAVLLSGVRLDGKRAGFSHPAIANQPDAA